MFLSYEELDSIQSVRSILESLGVQKLKDNGDYFHFSSPLREDKNPSMVLYKKNLFCIDFSGLFRGSIFKLYKEVTGESLLKDLKIDRNAFANVLYEKKRILTKDSFEKLDLSDFKMNFLRGSLDYDVFKYPEAVSYMKRRFITKEFAEYFHFAYAESVSIIRAKKTLESKKDLYELATHFRNRICIPIYFQDYLLSVEGRDLKGEYPKVIYPKGGSVSNLFNYDKLKKDEPLVVVEGIMDMPRIWTHITKNVTTTFGIQMTHNQKEQLKEFNNVILFPDTDDGGRKMVEIFDSFYEKPYRIAFLPFGDPGDKDISIKQIEKAIGESEDDTSYLLRMSELFGSEETVSDKMFWDFSL